MTLTVGLAHTQASDETCVTARVLAHQPRSVRASVMYYVYSRVLASTLEYEQPMVLARTHASTHASQLAWN